MQQSEHSITDYSVNKITSVIDLIDIKQLNLENKREHV